MAKVRGKLWFSDAARDPAKNQIIVEIIRNYFQSDHQVLDQTAENLITLICRSVVKCTEVWDVLFHLAKSVPTTHTNIVELLKAMFIWPYASQGREIQSKVESSFHAEWRETQADLRAKAVKIKTTKDPPVMPWFNFNVFTSRCISAGIIDPSWGLEHVVVALETDIEKLEMLPFKQLYLIIAGRYLINCADHFLQYNPQDNRGNGTCNPSWGCDSEVHPLNEGVTQERWQYWRVKLSNVNQYGKLTWELSGGSMYALLMMDEATKYENW